MLPPRETDSPGDPRPPWDRASRPFAGRPGPRPEGVGGGAAPVVPAWAPMPSIGLVLGAGGTAGFGYHIGTLAALAEATGWDPRTADLIVGTSAGANVAASLRAGVSIADHHAHGQGGPMSADGAAIGRYRGLDELGIPPAPGLSPAAFLRPAAPWLALPACFPPFPWRLGLLAGLLPVGTVSGAPLGERVRDLFGGPWPDAPTWVCATRVRDGRRVVFGRDDEDTDLGTAVVASSAVPAYIQPPRVNGHRYLDGALVSPTSADLVARLAFDLVVVVSPMSGGGEGAPFGRSIFTRLLEREVSTIREHGTPVLAIEPTAADTEALLRAASDTERVREMARSAHTGAPSWLEHPDSARALAILRSAASAPVAPTP